MLICGRGMKLDQTEYLNTNQNVETLYEFTAVDVLH